MDIWQREQPPDVRALDDRHQTATLATEGVVGPQQEPDAPGIDERHTAQVKHQIPAVHLRRRDRLLELGDGGAVQLPLRDDEPSLGVRTTRIFSFLDSPRDGVPVLR